MKTSTAGQFARRQLTVAGALAIGLLAWAPAAQSADFHAFDAALSLSGDCESSAATPPDTVPDPDCAGDPLEYPSDPLPTRFRSTCGAASDANGYLYVASTTGVGEDGWIDVFDAAGGFVAEIDTGEDGLQAACKLAVDSTGRLYVVNRATGSTYRYTPKAFPPDEEGYEPIEEFASTGGMQGVAVDRSDDHVYIATGPIREQLPDGTFLGSFGSNARDADVRGPGGDAYLLDRAGDEVRIHDGTTHELKETVALGTGAARSVAVEQASGDFYVTVCPPETTPVCAVRQFGVRGGSEYELVGQFGVDQGLEGNPSNGGSDLATDTPYPGEPAYASPNEGYVFVNSGAKAGAHHYAYAPLEVGPPVVSEQGASQVSADSARLEGKVEPRGAATSYRFEYTPAADFESEGWTGAIATPSGQIASPDSPPTAVFAPIAGLQAATSYRFRIVATNACMPTEPEVPCTTEGEREGGEEVPRSFSTYPLPGSGPCPNEALRLGPSAGLADCRAYELVTPADSGGRVPVWTHGYFDSSLTSPDGQSLIFGSETGALPIGDGNGEFDGYRARRGAEGWRTEAAGPSGAQSGWPGPIGISPEHSYILWEVYVSYGGSLVDPRGATIFDNYMRAADGTYTLIGRGEPGFEDDPSAETHWITAGAGHLIFNTVTAAGQAPRLRADSPPLGTEAIYDRTPAGLRTVSLLPGEIVPAAGQDATFLGASADGSAVAFSIGAQSYVRLGNAETVALGALDRFAGLSRDGARLFYLQGGDLFAFDTATAAATQIGSGGESTPIIPAPDGSRVYFSSPAQLDGAEGTPGEPNLYLWEGGSPRYVATLDPADFAGTVNLGNWVGEEASTFLGPDAHSGGALSPARSTADGSVLAFESHGDLTPPYESEGHSEVYRYEADAEELDCVSCSPTGAPAAGDARLQSVQDAAKDDERLTPPLAVIAPLANLTPDGQTLFFESEERLVSADTDGRNDVYRWRAQGSGGCERPGGCLAAISAGQSAAPDYLYAISPDGSDVFFRSADSLHGADTDGGVPSIYDARVGGGFPAPAPAAVGCVGDACQGAGAPAPAPPAPASAALQGPGNLKTPGRCAGLGRRAKKNGKRAKALRRRAAKSAGRRRSRALRRRAAKRARKARRLAAKAKACRKKSGRRDR